MQGLKLFGGGRRGFPSTFSKILTANATTFLKGACPFWGLCIIDSTLVAQFCATLS